MSDQTPPPPPGASPPPPMPPPGPQGPTPQNGLGTTALVMGILQFFCLGPIGSILAIVFGWMGMNKAKQGLADNGGVAKTGFWLGIAGIILSVIAGILFAFAGAAIFSTVSASLDPENNSRTGLADGRYVMTPDSFLYAFDQCSYTGVPYSEDTKTAGPADVTIVGEGSTQCPASNSVTIRVRSVTFTVSGGTAAIDSVQTTELGLIENES